jgi:hypothetical protein
MTSQNLPGELLRIGRWLNRRQGLVLLLFWAAAAAGLLALLAFSDVLFRYERVGRLAAAAVWAVVAAAGLAHVVLTLRRRHTPASVAARLERTFPELDNHLINRVLFGQHEHPTTLEKAYLQRPLPAWDRLDWSALRNRKAERIGAGAAAAALLILALPLLFTGPTWGNALLRVLNPLSSRRPISLTRFLACEPGDAAVQKGDALRLACRVHGRPGQALYLDLWPADDKPATVRVGRLAGNADEDFAHSLPKVATDFRYRFRAGDGQTETYRVRARTPLALARAALRVEPPAYAGLAPREFDALADPPEVPQGSAVTLSFACTEPLASATVAVDGGAPAPLRPLGRDGREWEGTLTVLTGTAFRVAGTDTDQRRLESDLRFVLRRDALPELRVLSPVGRATLSAGSLPRIAFEAADEYGLQGVALQRVRPGDPEGTNAAPLAEWAGAEARLLATNWTAAAEDFTPGETNLYRLVATDNAAGGPNVTRSALIVFTAARPADIFSTATTSAARAGATLTQLLEQQRNNLEATRRLAASPASAREQWEAAEQQQLGIRQLAGALLADPAKPLASLAETMRTLHAGAMLQAVDVLDRVPGAPDETNRTMLASQAVRLEAHILTQLTFAETGLARAQEHQKITGILALLDALVRNQDEVLTRTRAADPAKAAVPPALVDRQDRLAGDVNEFVQVCRRENENLQRSDKAFAESLVRAADTCEQRRIAPEMLGAAEHLEQNRPADAVPPEERALAALKDIQADLNAWRMA